MSVGCGRFGFHSSLGRMFSLGSKLNLSLEGSVYLEHCSIVAVDVISTFGGFNAGLEYVFVLKSL